MSKFRSTVDTGKNERRRKEPTEREVEKLLNRMRPFYDELLERMLYFYTPVTDSELSSREMLIDRYINLSNADGNEISEMLPGDKLYPVRKAAELIELVAYELAYLEKNTGVRYKLDELETLAHQEVVRIGSEECGGEGYSRPLTKREEALARARVSQIETHIRNVRPELERRLSGVTSDPTTLITQTIEQTVVGEILGGAQIRPDKVGQYLDRMVEEEILARRGLGATRH